MGGYLGYFNLREWYETLPLDIQGYLYISSGYGIGTDPERLLNGEVSCFSPSATQFLCVHAVNALHDRFHAACDAFMAKAILVCSSDDDRQLCDRQSERIREEKLIYPDQAEIEKYKPFVLDFIRANPGILQAHLKKHFPLQLEATIGLAYWQAYKAGNISRKPKGNSFQLFISEHPQEEL